jgi:replication factor C large subunit
MKIGRIYHTSMKDVLENILPDFSVIYDNDEKFRNFYTSLLHFDENEISYLTDKDPSEILKEAKKSKNKKSEGGSV